MALNVFCKRSAIRSVQKCQSRAFSTVVDDTFSPIASGSIPPPPVAQSRTTLEDAVHAKRPRYDWSKDEVREIYQTPLMELAFHSVSCDHAALCQFIKPDKAIGNATPPISHTISDSDVHADEYQDRRMQ